MHSTLIQMILLCSAAVIAVPLFRYFNIGAILAYLVAGIFLGPGVLGFIKDPDTILHFSELGVVFLLFIIGLELAPGKLWNLRKFIFGFGLLQVLVTGSLLTLLGVLAGYSVAASYIIGFGLSLSSTAFAIQILEENRQLDTTHGQGAFSVLMFQDIAVVPLLASLSFFVEGEAYSVSYWAVLKTLSFIIGAIVLGLFLVRHVLKLIAASRTPEVFIAASLLLVLGTAVGAEAVGLSMGMGAFLAGVLLANSEYRHELESNLMPFKGLLLELFFIAVGMSLNISVLAEKFAYVLGFCLALILIKATIVYFLGRMFRYPFESSRNMAFTLLQGGEFAFVIFSVAVSKNLIDSELVSILNAVVILSMFLTPFLFNYNQKRLRTYSELNERPDDVIPNQHTDVIIAGFGRFGQVVSRILKLEGISYNILEHSAEQVDTARKFANKVYYGDASKLDILTSAGASKAKYFILAIDDVEKSMQAAKTVRKNFPNLKIIARARNRRHAHELMRLDIEHIYRETFPASLEVARDVLTLNGLKQDYVETLIKDFRAYDEKMLKDQFEYMDNEKKFISFTIEANKRLVDTLATDRKRAENKSL